MNRIIKTSCILWLLACGFISPQILANPALYDAEVVVSEESVSARNTGIREAFKQVLIRLTGSRSIQERAGLSALVDQSASYVQQFRYRLQQAEAPTGTDTAEGAPTRYLLVSFDQQAVARALRELGQPVWVNHRPVVLVWLVADKSGKRSVIDVESDAKIRQALKGQASLRGLDLRFPLMDLEDQAQLTSADLWNGFEDRIRLASGRYSQSAILVGRLSQLDAANWSSRWYLLERENSEQLPAISANLIELQLMDGVDLAMDHLASRHAPVVGDDAPVQLAVRVTDVRSVSDYARVMRLLNEQPATHKILVRAAHTNGLDLDVWYRGGRAALERNLPVALVAEFAAMQPMVPIAPITPMGTGSTLPSPEVDLLIRYQH